MLNYIKMGNYLSKIRKNNGFTQEDISELIFVSDKTIRNIESGHCKPKFETILKLCDIYEIPLSNLQEFYTKDHELLYLLKLPIYKHRK